MELKDTFVTIVPLQETAYFYTELPSSLKLSSDLLVINYAARSPFKETMILHCKKEKHLCIWFTPKKNYRTVFVLPEGFLVYFSVFESRGDGLYCITFSQNKQLLTYIKKGILHLQFIVTDPSQIKMVEMQYRTSVHYLSREDYLSLQEGIWKNPKFLYALKQFRNISFSKEKLLTFIDRELYYPLIFVILIYIAISYYQTYTLEKEITDLTQTYQAIKTENSTLKQAVKEHNKKVRMLDTFIHEELYFTDPVEILKALATLVKKGESAKITYISISSGEMKLRIQTKEDAIKYFKRLNAMGYFDNIVIENTFKKKDGTKIYTYALVLKKVY